MFIVRKHVVRLQERSSLGGERKHCDEYLIMLLAARRSIGMPSRKNVNIAVAGVLTVSRGSRFGRKNPKAIRCILI